MRRRILPIIASVLASAVLLTALFALLSGARTRAAAPPTSPTGLSGATSWHQETYTPVVTITQPIADAILTTTHRTYPVHVAYTCGTTCVGSALLDSVSVTVDGGVTYHEAVSEAVLGQYVYTWTLPEDEDFVTHTLIAQARNGWGNVGTSDPVTVYVDTVAPQTALITVPNYTENTTFTVSWSAADGSGVVRYDLQVQRDDQASWTGWVTGSSQTAQVFTVTQQEAEEGHDYTFRMRARDKGHNASDWVEAATRVGRYRLYLPLVVRNYPPQPEGSVVIEEGAATVYQQSVTLTLTATVSGDTVADMRFSNDGANWSDWEPFATAKSWTLVDGTSGLRTVYARFRGSQGGVSAPASDQAYLSLNGSFESGDVSPGWQKVEDPLPVSIVESVEERPSGSTPPADGDYALLLGRTDYPCASDGVPLGYAAIEQTFSLPSSAEVMTLTFKYIIWTQDASPSEAYDRFEVYVGDQLEYSDGNQVNEGLDCNRWWRVPGPDNPREGQTDGWATGEIDLSAYAGQSVTISFRNYSRYDGWYNTYTYIDGVTVEGGW